MEVAGESHHGCDEAGFRGSMMFGLKFLFRRRRLNQDLDEEIRAHLAIDQEERVDRGESPQACRAKRPSDAREMSC